MTDIATNIWIWLGFSAFIVVALVLDSYILYSKVTHPYQSIKAALSWTIVWIVCALIFNLLLWVYLQETTNPSFANSKALDFLTGYVIEKSLSVDNLFVFYMIFQQFKIPLKSQQRVFNYGVYSAIVMRLIVILAGVWLINRFHWIIYIMGAFLVITGLKMALTAHQPPEAMISPFENKILKFLQTHLRFTKTLSGEKFFIKQKNLWYATPLVMVLILIEFSDIAFAFDSIPAIFAITRDPFIVWSSNIFAILGLRALYFFIANIVQRFFLLKYGIAIILLFVGCKILLEQWVKIPVSISLGVIISILIVFSLLSLLLTKAPFKRKR